jgi:hypothetical protein
MPAIPTTCSPPTHQAAETPFNATRDTGLLHDLAPTDYLATMPWGASFLPIRRSTGSTYGFWNIFGRLSMTRVKATAALC